MASNFNQKAKPYRHTSDYFRKVKRSLKHEKSIISLNKSKADLYSSATEVSSVMVTSLKNKCESQQNIENIGDSAQCNDFSLPEIDESDREHGDNINDKLTFINELREWALQNKLTHYSVSELLKILRSHGMTHLPQDSRTLLHTPTTIELINMGSGQYWYNGVKSNLQAVLHDIIKNPISIYLKFNVDGISPYNSSALEFWPILFTIDNMPYLKPMVAAVYYGHGKPPLNPFLSPIVHELNTILQEGLQINQYKIDVKIKCFICDTPARSFIKGVAAFNAEYGACIKCTVVGEWDKGGRHMSYPRIHCPLRTDESFRNKVDEDHHKEDTPLTKLPINLVEDVIIADSLHLFELGVMRKCLFAWCRGSYNYRTKLSAADMEKMSTMLGICNALKPTEIHRAIRGLKFLKYWKGSEFRTFLLYLGIIILKDFLPGEVYEHFLTLSCAVTILMSNEYMKFLNIADALLKDYIEGFINIYGIDSVSSNIHNLCHVVNDVKKFGILPGISSYPFESFLGYFKCFLRTGNLPLAQIAKRLTEFSKLSNPNPKRCVSAYVKDTNLVKEHHESKTCKNIYNKIYLADEFILANDIKNKWFLTKNTEIVAMKNATTSNGNLCIYGIPLQNKYDFFTKPFKSSYLNIYASKGEVTEPKIYQLNDIKCKLFSLKYHNDYVFLPLIHTLDANACT